MDTAHEVVLTWPFKADVMEGRNDSILHKKLTAAEAEKLFARKLFTDFSTYNNKGEEKPNGFSVADNFIIKGDNLIVLHSLKEIFSDRVRLIYIDPPYNTGKNGFNYKDTFNHGAWLTFMRNRIEIAYRLLAENGTLWINIDDRESHYLKVLCDEIFGRDNFVINFIWQKKYSPANDARWFSDNHDHILVFAKNKQLFQPHLLPRSPEMNERYINLDNDPRGPWKAGGYSVKTYTEKNDYPIQTPSGKIVYPPKGSCWQTSKENFEKRLADNRIWFGVKGGSKPQIKQFLSEVQPGRVAKSIWTYDEVGHNQVSRREIVKLFGALVFATPKPERLLKRILELATNQKDLVLDFFLGSGTTAAVAHKMSRQYIGIDQMDYIRDVAVARLKKVIEGEQGGISEATGWKGGGQFHYMELAGCNGNYINLSETFTEHCSLPPEDIELTHKFYSAV